MEDVKFRLVRIRFQMKFVVLLHVNGRVICVLRNHVHKQERVLIMIVMII